MSIEQIQVVPEEGGLTEDQKKYREALAKKTKERHKEFVERRTQELEAQGWRQTGDVEKIDEARTDGISAHEYIDKYEIDDHVFTRTKEAAKEAQEKRKQIRKNLVVAIKPILEELGFEKDKKDKSTWQRVADGVVQVFNLQTSHLGQEYFFNVGIYVKPLEEEKPLPKELDCQFRERLDYFIGGDEFKSDQNLSSLTDFESAKTVDEAQPKIDKIAECLQKYVVPFFNEAISKESLEEYKKHKVKNTAL